jgi:hypothetical protein
MMTANLCEVTSDRKTAGVRLSSLPACRRSFRIGRTLPILMGHMGTHVVSVSLYPNLAPAAAAAWKRQR